MSAFIPKGYIPLADLVDDIGIEVLRSQLASGEITAVEYWTRDGRMKEVARQVWLSNQGPGILKYTRWLMDNRGQVYLVEQKPATREDKGGRPPKWDWPGAMAFAKDYIDKNGHQTQGKMVALIREWFTSSVGEEPNERHIQREVAKLYRGGKT